MTGYITAIFTAPARHASQIAVDAVQLKAGKGIVGDRFFGFSRKNTGKNLSLIESEVLEEFFGLYKQPVEFNASRRNFITRGIRLNELVGTKFLIGEVLCEGVELCEPCKVMARQMPQLPLSQAEIIKAFAYRGGLRANVLTDGIVRIGDHCLAISNDKPKLQ
jgi:MOSC domain-containing protein YiiM